MVVRYLFDFARYVLRLTLAYGVAAVAGAAGFVTVVAILDGHLGGMALGILTLVACAFAVVRLGAFGPFSFERRRIASDRGSRPAS